MFQSVSEGDQQAKTGAVGNPEMDLGEVQQEVVGDVQPESMTADDFKTKYPTVVASVSVNMGATETYLKL